MSEWELPIDFQYYNNATFSSRSFRADVGVDEAGMDIDLEQGSGYMREHLTTHIPMDVLIRLFERAGYTITRSATSVQDNQQEG